MIYAETEHVRDRFLFFGGNSVVPERRQRIDQPAGQGQRISEDRSGPGAAAAASVAEDQGAHEDRGDAANVPEEARGHGGRTIHQHESQDGQGQRHRGAHRQVVYRRGRILDEVDCEFREFSHFFLHPSLPLRLAQLREEVVPRAQVGAEHEHLAAAEIEQER